MARILTVKVQPRSKARGVEELGPGDYRVRVGAAPERGQANREVVERLAAHLDVPPSSLTLVRGASSSRKIFKLEP
jgi:uncharacterized protein YggU (UPF0235/DUF167 family)